jgi:hypothetical protein
MVLSALAKALLIAKDILEKNSQMYVCTYKEVGVAQSVQFAMDDQAAGVPSPADEKGFFL